jgi:site-specific recombinase XerD
MDLYESFSFYRKYLKFEKNLTPNTIRSYQKDLLHLLDFYKEKKISDTSQLSLGIFREYMKALDGRNYSNRTIIRKYSSFINYFRFLENNSLVDSQLNQAISVPKKRHRFYSYLSVNEMEKLFETVKTEGDSGIRDRTIIELIYSTGARVSEIENLKVRDIDLLKNEAVVTGKGRKQRIVYINSEALPWLDRYLKIRANFGCSGDRGYPRDEHLFLNRFGTRLSARSIRTIVKKNIKKAGISKNVSAHSLRHSFATHLLQEGAGIREIQELLGHENVSTTQIYSHLNIKKLKKDYKKFHPRAK